VLARTAGSVTVSNPNSAEVSVTIRDSKGNEDTYTLPPRVRLEVKDGDVVEVGDPLVEGPRDPKELLLTKGIRAAQQYIVDEVQKVYREQGVSIHDKHIELIARQMLRRIVVTEPGDSGFLPGEKVDMPKYIRVNRELVKNKTKPAEARAELMGITKASLATDSWLSAASFQETTRVLTEAAIEGSSDKLLGLKENIIIGKLIPAGTGAFAYKSLHIANQHPQRLDYWSSQWDESSEDGLLGNQQWEESAGENSPGKNNQGENLATWLRDIGRDTAGAHDLDNDSDQEGAS
jgi:DNA-directed RNA polymerase subunit beta'